MRTRRPGAPLTLAMTEREMLQQFSATHAARRMVPSGLDIYSFSAWHSGDPALLDVVTLGALAINMGVEKDL